MTFFSRCILAFFIAAISSELVQARGRRSHSQRPKAFPKGNKELLVRVMVVYEKKYVGLYVAMKKNATCIADHSVPHELFNRSRENELLERAERTVVQLQYFKWLDGVKPLLPEDLRENQWELFDFCSLNPGESPYKTGQTGFLKTEDSEYNFPSFSASSSGDPLPENATVPTRDDDGYPQMPGCKLEKVDLDNRRGRGCQRYENPGKQPCVECLYHDCNKKVLGEANLKKPPTTPSLPKPDPTLPKLPHPTLPKLPHPTLPKLLHPTLPKRPHPTFKWPSRPTEELPSRLTEELPSRPTEELPVVSLEKSEGARGSDAAKEAEREARKEARKAEKQAERKREREAKKKHKAKSQ